MEPFEKSDKVSSSVLISPGTTAWTLPFLPTFIPVSFIHKRHEDEFIVVVGLGWTLQPQSDTGPN